jgi:hypothetical protein
MGEVYRARDTRLGRDVALKVLPADVARDPDRLARFAQEARTVSALNHPNIITIYDVGVEADQPYVIFELLRGMTLRHALADHRISTARALGYAAQIAEGIGAAHEHGIVHRDLKPENVFLTRDGRIKVLDFGLAKIVAPASAACTTAFDTQAGAVLGTVGYMSPEQVHGQPVDSRSDVFALGAIVYEMLAGRRAFPGGSSVETMNAIITQDPPPLATLNPNLSPAIETVVRRCLEKRVEARFQSARDLAFALEKLTALSTAASGPASSAAKRTTTRLLAAMAIFALLVASVVAGYLIGVARPPAQPSMRQLTFRRGTIGNAMFSPDGQTIVYDAAWDGKPYQIASVRLDTGESLLLPLPDATLLSVSSSGELAILLREGDDGGTLARVPLGGSGPRELLDHVVAAAWAPNGTPAVITHDRPATRDRLEFPIGTVLYEAPLGALVSLRVAPDGELIAIIEQDHNGGGWLRLINLKGEIQQQSQRWAATFGAVAWTPNGKEAWFSASEVGLDMSIHALAVGGGERIVQRGPGSIQIADIAADGRAAIVHGVYRAGMVGFIEGGNHERDVSWMDWSRPSDLSSDGKTLLFGESGVGAGFHTTIFVRATDGSAAVRLGEGTPLALSPDGKWVLAIAESSPERLTLLPTGAGQPRALEPGSIGSFAQTGGWTPDGKRIVFLASEIGHGRRIFVQDTAGSRPRAITPEGARGPVVLTPDGRYVLAADSQERRWLYPLDGGTPVHFADLVQGEMPLRWSADGKSVWTLNSTSRPPRIVRLDLATSRRETLHEISSLDPAGLQPAFERFVIVPNGKSYVYGYTRLLADLYVAAGLK